MFAFARNSLIFERFPILAQERWGFADRKSPLFVFVRGRGFSLLVNKSKKSFAENFGVVEGVEG